jgi:hypothetical protein
MEPVMQRIQKALRKEFPSKGILLEDAGDGFVGGWIISKSFEGLDGAQRQKRVWNLFDKYLDHKDRDRLAVFLTFTPIEKKEIFAEDIDEKPAKKKSLSARKKSMAVGRKNGGVRQKRR